METVATPDAGASIAAIACVLLLSGTYSFYLYRNTETADNRFALETAYGEKSKLILADIS